MARNMASLGWDRFFALVQKLELLPSEARDGAIREEVSRGAPRELLSAAMASLKMSSTESSMSTPDSIGAYEIGRRIGEGGMGAVFLAEQHEPVRRQVALKVVKRGMDTEEVLSRFAAEQQALAMMDHPAIAKIYDAGVTPEGRPYFAMEFVPGVPITDHCDEHELSVRARLDLFLQVCKGVQHAHQKAVIHRDIKPSNVLVSMQDGAPVPKLIDFGLAKAIGHRLTDKTVHTEYGAFVGTLEYMSPEQAAMDGQDVDTVTDVYALGVLLYQLLVGALPFEAQALRKSGIEAALRTIRDEEPLRPSLRLSSLPDQELVVAARQSSPASLRRALTGDLDWIVLKALEKDPTRRYGSVQEFAADIQRHLGDQAVVARPPSALYRAGKFARRHRGPVIGSCLAALLAAVAISGLTYGYFAAVRAQAEARTQADISNKVLEFVEGLFLLPSSAEDRANLTATDILELGLLEIDEQLGGQPRSKARLLGAIGNVYLGLGKKAQGMKLIEQARTTRESALPEGHPDLIWSLWDQAWGFHNVEEYEAARATYVEVVRKLKAVYGPSHVDTLEAIVDLAHIYIDLEQYDDAISILRDVVGLDSGRASDLSRQAVRAMFYRASALWRSGRVSAAKPLLEEALGKYREYFGPHHAATLIVTARVASLYLTGNMQELATPLLSELLAAYRQRASMVNSSPADKIRFAELAVTCEPLSLRDPDGALPFALAANESTNWTNPRYLDVLARVYFQLNDAERSIDLQKRGIDLLHAASPLRPDMERRMREYLDHPHGTPPRPLSSVER
ncbi:MAG: serine/threonine-protein kinase [Pseudomonadota bacterium]